MSQTPRAIHIAHVKQNLAKMKPMLVNKNKKTQQKITNYTETKTTKSKEIKQNGGNLS